MLQKALYLCALLPMVFPPALRAAPGPKVRKPLGIYAKIDIEDAILAYKGPASGLHDSLRQTYAGLLSDPAISGITVGRRWDNIQVSDPLCILQHSCLAGPDGYDWSYLDDVFAEAELAHKSVQLIVTPGADAPSWLLAKIPSCDPLFSTGSAPPNCGKVTFTGYPEQQRVDNSELPLPWNPIYNLAWWDFLVHVSVRYGFNPLLVSIAVAGPVAGSPEMILPTSANSPPQVPPGCTATPACTFPVDTMWSMLINHSFPNVASYQSTDQVFIDQWKQTIDVYELVFSGLTLQISPDAGKDTPEFVKNPVFTPHPDNFLYAANCSTTSTPRSCEAKTEVLSYFDKVSGPNAKSTQVGGLTASTDVAAGDIGIATVKMLATPPSTLLGGAEFDHPVSTGNNTQQTGCPTYPDPSCDVTPDEGAYYVLRQFFYGTRAAVYYGGTYGPALLQYLDLDYSDVQSAQSEACPSPPSTDISLQDLLNHASYDLFTMAGMPVVLPPKICP